MKNRKMVTMLDEALQSPVGSTKRQQAKAMLGSLTAVKNNNSYVEDGMGGGFGDFWNSPRMEQLKGAGSSIWDKFSGDAKDAAQMTGDTLRYGKDMFQQGIEGAYKYGKSGAAASADVMQSEMGQWGLPGGTTPALPQGDMSMAPIPQKKAVITGGSMKEGFDPTDPVTQQGGMSLPGGTQTGGMSVLPTDLNALAKANDPKFYTGKSPEQIKSEQNARYAQYEYNRDDEDATEKLFLYGDSDEAINKVVEENPSSVESWLYDYGIDKGVMQTFVDSGIGAPGAASMIMQNEKLFKEIFGPDVNVDEDLIGATLSRQVFNLKDRKKEEYQVDELLDNVKDLTSRNLSVESDLQAYIRGRDTYLKKIDGMIDDVKDKFVDMDTSNPNTAKHMKKYSDYLHILKGRQLMRYTDYVQTSVDQANNELIRMQDLYNTQLTAFNEAFQEEGTILAEDYTMMKDILENMYTNLDGQEMKEIEIESAKNDLLLQQFEIFKATNPSDDFKSMTGTEKNYYLEQMGLRENSDGQHIDTGMEKSSDLYKLKNDAIGYGFDPERMQDYFIKNTRKTLMDEASYSGNYTDNVSFYNSTMSKLGRDGAFDPNITSIDDLINSDYRYDADLVAKAMSGGLQDGLKDYFTDKEDGEKRVNTLRKMIRDLTGSGIYKKESKREKWGNDDESNIADTLWDMWAIKIDPTMGAHAFFDGTKNDDGTIKTQGFDKNMPSKDLIELFTEQMSKDILDKYYKEFLDSFINIRTKE